MPVRVAWPAIAVHVLVVTSFAFAAWLTGRPADRRLQPAAPPAGRTAHAIPGAVRWVLPTRAFDIVPTRALARGDEKRGDITLEHVARLALTFAPDDTNDTSARHFTARTPGYTLRVGATSAVVRPATGTGPGIGLALRGGNDAASADAAWTGAQVTRIGPDGAARRTPLASRVVFRDVYPGVDVAYYGTGQMVEHDFVVAPHGALEQIAIDVVSATPPSLAPDGSIVLGEAPGAPRLAPPVSYQLVGTSRRAVPSRYRIDGATVRFDVEDYDPSLPLVIDPVISYAVTLGGTRYDEGAAIAVDGAGNVVVTGPTLSDGFPSGTAAPRQADVFVLKLDATGTVVMGSMILGGSGDDEPRALDVDDTGAVYVGGRTTSPDFPAVRALRATAPGNADGFVTKIDANLATVVFSTYLGGSGHDEVTGLAVNATRDVFVTGATSSADFPTVAAAQGALRGTLDGFVMRVDAGGQALHYSTFVGGSGVDTAQAIAVTPGGEAAIAGTTRSADFPIVGASQAALAGDVDAFVTSVTATGAIRFSTYQGGTQGDMGQGVAIDGQGRVFLAGTSASVDLVATTGQVAHGGGLDAFVTSYGAGGARTATTFIGGAGRERARAIAVDHAGYVYVAGQTSSPNFPVVRAARGTIGGGRDTFVSMLDPATLQPIYATFLGGVANDDAQGIAIDPAGRACVTGALGFADGAQRGASDVFVTRVSSGLVNADTDNDNLPDDWEVLFRLDPLSQDASGDPDGDGVTNAQEYAQGTHPRGVVARYTAEGATSAFFDTRFAVLNPSDGDATVLIRAMTSGGAVASFAVAVAARSRTTVDAKSISGLASAEFSAVIESDTLVVIDRQMTWDATGYGSHAETATEQPDTTWYLAEGATHSGLDVFYLVQNPSDDTADLRITYLRPAPRPPIVKRYLVAPRSRQTIWVDREDVGLSATDVSAVVESMNGVAVLVERSVYLNSGGRTFGSGHASSAVRRPAMNWFLAEGATGAYFDLFVLMANPGPTPASVRATYLLPGGTSIVKTYEVAPSSRLTVWVDLEDPALADTAVSTIVESLNGVPIIVERALWWPGPTSRTWQEAHNSAGSTTTGTRWGMAEGEQGGVRKVDTYILIANTSPFDGDVDVTLYFEDDGATATKRFRLSANSRFNVQVAYEFPQALGRRFGAVVASAGTPAAQIVVERAMYSSTATQAWAAGTNALATLLSSDVTITLSASGLSPRTITVPIGARLRVVNADTRAHWFASDPHPEHTDCPELDQVGFLQPGDVRESGNLTRAVTCGVHDHLDFQNPLWKGTLTVR